VPSPHAATPRSRRPTSPGDPQQPHQPRSRRQQGCPRRTTARLRRRTAVPRVATGVLAGRPAPGTRSSSRQPRSRRQPASPPGPLTVRQPALPRMAPTLARIEAFTRRW